MNSTNYQVLRLSEDSQLIVLVFITMPPGIPQRIANLLGG